MWIIRDSCSKSVRPLTPQLSHLSCGELGRLGLKPLTQRCLCMLDVAWTQFKDGIVLFQISLRWYSSLPFTLDKVSVINFQPSGTSVQGIKTVIRSVALVRARTRPRRSRCLTMVNTSPPLIISTKKCSNWPLHTTWLQARHETLPTYVGTRGTLTHLHTASPVTLLVFYPGSSLYEVRPECKWNVWPVKIYKREKTSLQKKQPREEKNLEVLRM